MSHSAATETSRLRLVLTAGAAAALAGLLYANSLNNPFVYDDIATILQNPTIDRLDEPWSIVMGAATRPFVNLSYAVDRAFWGREPFGFHLTNVLLHMLNVLLLYAFARRAAIDYRDRPGADVATGSPDAIAAGAAILFAIHPMMSESVGYVSGRSELFAASFVLLCLLSASRWMRGGGFGSWIATVVCWLGALLSKEVAAMLPLVLIAYDRWIVSGSSSERRRRLLCLHAPMLTVTLFAGIVRLLVMIGLEYGNDVGWHWQLVPIQLDVMRRYLELFIVPHHQSIYHGASSLRGFFDPRVLAIPILVTAAIVMAFRNRASRLATFGLVAFVLFLVPSSLLYVLNIGEVMAEHRAYVASLGVFLVFGCFVGWLTGQLHLVGAGARRVAWVALALVAVQLAALTVARNRVWSSPETLWREAVQGAPADWLPNAQLAEALRQTDRCGEALAYYKRALDSQPEQSYLPFVYSRLGACELQLNRFADATRTFSTLSWLAPRSAEGPLGLALVMVAQKDGPDPRAQLQMALRREPDNIGARQLLASLEESNNPSEALRLCREIQHLAPDTPGVADCVARNESRTVDRQ